jgi:PAS domain S-box-containing protein
MLRPLKNQLELFHLIFDNIYNGAMVTDAGGIVTHLNKPYARFLGLDAAESIGKHCTAWWKTPACISWPAPEPPRSTRPR